MDGARMLWAVADGVGGAPCGDRVAQLCCETVHKSWDRLSSTLRDPAMRAAASVRLADRAAGMFVGTRGHEGSGATLLVASLDRDVLGVAAAGDCRAYLLRHARLSPVLAGGRRSYSSSTPDAACGWGMESEPRTASLEVQAGDLVVLCTDGVWATQPEHRMEEVLVREAEGTRGERAWNVARALACSSDMSDNATAVVITLEDRRRRASALPLDSLEPERLALGEGLD